MTRFEIGSSQQRPACAKGCFRPGAPASGGQPGNGRPGSSPATGEPPASASRHLLNGATSWPRQADRDDLVDGAGRTPARSDPRRIARRPSGLFVAWPEPWRVLRQTNVHALAGPVGGRRTVPPRRDGAAERRNDPSAYRAAPYEDNAPPLAPAGDFALRTSEVGKLSISASRTRLLSSSTCRKYASSWTGSEAPKLCGRSRTCLRRS